MRVAEYARIKQYTIPLRHWTFPGGGSLEFLSPGKQNKDYLATLSALDWDNFYEKLNGGEFLDALRDEMKAYYDYTLIDSRTGLSDVADICTVHLPDVLVDCFTLSTQGVEGSAHGREASSRNGTGSAASACCRCRCGWTCPSRSESTPAGYSPSGASRTSRPT